MTDPEKSSVAGVGWDGEAEKRPWDSKTGAKLLQSLITINGDLGFSPVHPGESL